MNTGGNSSKGDVMKDAAHIWSMLDEMADSDPEGYKKFIKKTMEEGEKRVILPKPYVCIQSSLLGLKKSALYINMCSWEHVPRTKTDTDPVAVASGPLETGRDQTGEHSNVRIAFHPYVLKESFKNAVDKDLLINLGMDYIEQHHSVKVCRTYKILKDLKFKGDPASLTSSKRFFGKREKTEEEVIEENLAGLSPDSLLGKIQELSTQDDLARPELEERLRDLALGSSDSMGDGGKKKVGLIEEVSSAKFELPTPKHTVDLMEADAKRKRRLELRLALDGVQSVAECELDISEDEVNLYVEGKYELCLPLPEPINESEAKAKFIKKTSTLVVTLQTQSHS